MSIQEYLLIIKEKFDYLFKDYSFKVVYTKEFRPDHNLIGIESDGLRILFEQERGGFGIFIGPMYASFDNRVNDWVNIYSLMNYLLKRETDWNILEEEPYSKHTDIVFSVTAKEFAPIYKKVVEMFRSSDAVAKWAPIYTQYVKDKIQKRVAKE